MDTETEKRASMYVCAYSDEGARLKTPQPPCCVYTRRWLGDVLLVVTVEHSTVYVDYTDLPSRGPRPTSAWGT